jgi:ribosome-associated protein
LSFERKGSDVVAMDLRGISSATDAFLLVSGNSDIQVKAIADHVLAELRKEGIRPNHVEGLEGGRWVLLDFVDWVMHIFHPTAREFYQLERLWGDAPVQAFHDE